MSLSRCIAVLPAGTIKNLQATYLYNVNSSVKEYVKINERFFSQLKVVIIIQYPIMFSRNRGSYAFYVCFYEYVTELREK